MLRQLGDQVLEVRELAGGYAYRFAADEPQLMQVVRMIVLEKECCPFLSFGVRIAAGDDSAWVELTGPEGTKDFLATMFAVN